ncbi:MAG: hypothetical protein KDN18_05655 [Verrucomicrobiae bacterium]|nr:hypothetical protein [Verrucomicrobiae bacterium]
MNRRAIFKNLVALLGLPSGLAGGALSAPATSPAHYQAKANASGSTSQPWLEEWFRLPMQPVISPRDLESCRDERVRDLAKTILAHPGGGVPLVFHYHGGSDPGSLRSVFPVLLFRKFDPDLPASEGIEDVASDPIYLLAHCQVRGAARTFRLDRMGPVGVPWIFN